MIASQTPFCHSDISVKAVHQHGGSVYKFILRDTDVCQITDIHMTLAKGVTAQSAVLGTLKLLRY